MDVTELGKCGVPVSGECGDADAEAFRGDDYADDFIAFAAVADGDEQVVLLNHSEVSVHGFNGMHEDRGRAGACHGRGDFAADMTAFSDARNDDFSALVECFAAGLRQFDKVFVQIVLKSFKSFDFNGNDLFRLLQYSIRIHDSTSCLRVI